MSILIAATLAAAMSSPMPPQQQQRVAPRGSYAQSCSEAYVHQGRLYADCRDRSRQMRGTSIELARCGDAEIVNDNGLLVCGRFRGDYEDSRPGRPGNGNGGGWGGGNGGGWGRSSITVYTDSNYRGASREFTSEDRNLGNTPFNDRISSIRVQGRWEVCTDAQFGGRCRIIDSDQRNLSGGFNDNISSVRPVGGRR
jgi:hypothetical protein